MAYTLYDYQNKAMQSVYRKLQDVQRLLLVAPTGCHAPGQGILMYDGSIKRVEDVSVGDALMGPDSSLRQVLRLIQGEGRMFRITPVKGQSFVVNEDHILTLIRTNDGWGKANSIVDVSVREYLGWSKTQKHIHKLFRVPALFQPQAPLPLEPYFLGLLLGDGDLTHSRVCISKPDPEIEAEVSRQAQLFGIRYRKEMVGNRCPNLFLANEKSQTNPIRKILLGFGLAEKNSHTKFVPAEYLTASRKDRLELLAGLMDTDGSLTNNGFDFISASKALAENTAFLARSVGLAAYVSECEKSCQNDFKGTYWRVSISGETSTIPCRIERKKAAERIQKKSVLRTGFSVTAEGDGKYFGFTLSRDGRYLLDDFTVTHNSGKTVMAAHGIEEFTRAGMRVIFLAHRAELIQQCANKLDENGVPHGIIKNGMDKGGHNEQVYVASIQTLQSRFKNYPHLKNCVIIYDEAHHGPSEKNHETVNWFTPRITLGLTATPYRLDGKPLGDLFDDFVEASTTAELIEKGNLVPFRIFRATQKADLSRVHRNGGDYNPEELSQEMRRPRLLGHALTEYQRISYGRRAIGFCVDVAHSKAAAETFCEAGIRAEYVSGDTGEKERNGIIDRLTSGKTLVVFNCGVWTEGFDCPPVETLLGMRYTESRGLWRQMFGRVLRTSEATCKTHAIILDHCGWTERHGYVTDPDIFSLKGGLSQERPKATSTCPVCGASFAIKPPICPCCFTSLRSEQAKPQDIDLGDPRFSLSEDVNLFAGQNWNKPQENRRPLPPPPPPRIGRLRANRLN